MAAINFEGRFVPDILAGRKRETLHISKREPVRPGMLLDVTDY
jgi:hypothetical protein